MGSLSEKIGGFRDRGRHIRLFSTEIGAFSKISCSGRVRRIGRQPIRAEMLSIFCDLPALICNRRRCPCPDVGVNLPRRVALFLGQNVARKASFRRLPSCGRVSRPHGAPRDPCFSNR